MYEDLVLTYNRACGITCNTVVTEEREKKQMAKPSVDKNREALRAKRREQARELNEFCKARGICVRCKNPDKKVVVASTLCEGCKGYYKQYSSTMRSKQAAEPKKLVKTEVVPNRHVKIKAVDYYERPEKKKTPAKKAKKSK